MDGGRAKKRCRPGGRVVQAEEEEKEEALGERCTIPKRITPASAAAARGGTRGRSMWTVSWQADAEGDAQARARGSRRRRRARDRRRRRGLFRLRLLLLLDVLLLLLLVLWAGAMIMLVLCVLW